MRLKFLAMWFGFVGVALLMILSPLSAAAGADVPAAADAGTELVEVLQVLDPDVVQRAVLSLAESRFGAWLIAIVIFCRFAIKPAFAFLEYRAAQTPGTDDDERLRLLAESGWFRALAFFLDLVFSVKLRGLRARGNGGTLGLLICAGLCAVTMGCSTFTTDQRDITYGDEGKKEREITTRAKARTFWDSKSALATFNATQTDKTQSAKVGGLTQESSGTNAVHVLNAIEGILKAVPK